MMPRARRSPAWLVAALLVSGAACGGLSNTAAPQRAAQRAVLVAQPVVFVPANIDFTGKKDVTAALQSFIDNVDNGRMVRFHLNGRYRVEGTLFVTNKTSGIRSCFFFLVRRTK